MTIIRPTCITLSSVSIVLTLSACAGDGWSNYDDPYQDARHAISFRQGGLPVHDQNVSGTCGIQGSEWWIPLVFIHTNTDRSTFRIINSSSEDVVEFPHVQDRGDYAIHRVPADASAGLYIAQVSCGDLCTQILGSVRVTVGPPPELNANLAVASVEVHDYGDRYQFISRDLEAVFQLEDAPSAYLSVELWHGPAYDTSFQVLRPTDTLPIAVRPFLDDENTFMVRVRSRRTPICIRLYDTCSGQTGDPECVEAP